MNRNLKNISGIIIIVAALIAYLVANAPKKETETQAEKTSDTLVENTIVGPIDEPTEAPTVVPTEEPTEMPTATPTEKPTEAPTEAPIVTPTVAPTEAPTVSQTYTFRSAKLLNQHYEKHGIEMGFASASEYEKAAAAVINNSAALHKLESEDGDHVYYVEATNEFVILSTDGYIRTYFLPSGGRSYYDRQ